MNRYCLPLVAAIVWGVIPIAPVSAGLLSQIVTFDGIEDSVQDNSVATVLDDGDNFLDNGDVIVSIVRLTKNITHSIDIGPLGEVDVVFAARVTGTLDVATSGLTSHLGFTLGNAPGVLAGLLPSHAIGTNDAFAILTHSGDADDVTSMAYEDAFNALDSGSYELDATGTTDIFQAAFLDWDGNGAITLPEHADGYEYANAELHEDLGKERGGFTYTTIFGSSIFATESPLPVNLTQLVPWLPATSRVKSPHDVTLEANLEVPTEEQFDNGWLFANNSYLKTNLTPEPNSAIALTSILVVSAAAWMWPRRRKA